MYKLQPNLRYSPNFSIQHYLHDFNKHIDKQPIIISTSKKPANKNTSGSNAIYTACVTEFKNKQFNPCLILRKFGIYDLTKKNIYFLKTHKTAGSTFQSILFRLARLHDIHKMESKYDEVLGRNIFAHHDYYEEELTELYFPKLTTFYITIIRDPVSLYLSAYNYYDKVYDVQSEFEYITFLVNRTTDDKDICTHINSNCHHFGFVNCLENKHIINKEILKKTLSIFDLVLVAEYFDEGIILFKKLFNLNYREVLSLKLNIGHTKAKPPTQKLINEINRISNCDKLLFDYFLKFYQIIKPYLQTEVKILRAKQKQLYNLCIEGSQLAYTESNYMFTGYKLKKNLTRRMKIFCSSFAEVKS